MQTHGRVEQVARAAPPGAEFYSPLVNLPGGWELILVSLAMLALLVWVIWRVGSRR